MTQNRVRPGIPTGGQFAPTTHSEADVELRPGGDTNAELDQMRAVFSASMGSWAHPNVTDEFAADYQSATAAAGMSHEQALAYLQADITDARDAVALHNAGLDADDLAAYRAIEADMSPWNAISMKDSGITPQRWQDVIERYGLRPHVAKLVADTDDAYLADYLARVRAKSLTRSYAHPDAIRVLHPHVSPQEAEAYAAVFDTPRDALRAKQQGISADAAAQYRAASGIKNPESMLAYAAAGVEPADAKAFGPRFTPDDVRTLKDHGTPAKVAKSLRNFDRGMVASDITAWHRAGVSTGDEMREWDSVGFGTPAAVAKAKKSGLHVDAATKMHAHRVPLDQMIDAHRHLGDLDRWQGSMVSRANSMTLLGTTEQRYAQGYAALIQYAREGGTPDALRRAQRAGVPIHRAGEAARIESSGADVWAFGAQFRDAEAAEAARLRERWGGMADEATPWPYTRDTFADPN